MRILFDHQTFVYQDFGGISRYFVELLDRLNKMSGVRVELSPVLSDNLYLRERGRHSYTLMRRHFPFKMTIYNAIGRFLTLLKMKRGTFDVFHPTYYDTYFLDRLGNVPLVITVHDMIHEMYAKGWTNKEETISNKAVLIQKAAHIIAVSESTKRDLLHFFPQVPENKITVIWHGHSVAKHFKDRKPFPSCPAKDSYLLYVGKRDIYKNFSWMLRSLASYLKNNTDLDLVAAGGGPFTKNELNLLEELDIKGRVTLFSLVDDAQLAQLYANAFAFVFPSSYEGFGIPILEAFSADCPVLLNNKSCLPEVGGDGAMYFQEEDPASLILCIEELKQKPEYKKELIEAGRKRLRLFNWDITAAKTLEVYKTVVKNHAR